MKVKVFLIEENSSSGLSRGGFVEEPCDYEILGRFGNAEDCIKAMKNGQEADVIIISLKLPNMDCFEAIETIAEKFPKIKIIAQTERNNREELLASLKSGAVGYITKDIDSNSLNLAIETVNGGLLWIDPEISNTRRRAFQRTPSV